MRSPREPLDDRVARIEALEDNFETLTEKTRNKITTHEIKARLN